MGIHLLVQRHGPHHTCHSLSPISYHKQLRIVDAAAQAVAFRVRTSMLHAMTGHPTARGVDPTHRTFVSYIDKSRDYYQARGYANPYRWACFEDVPFTRLHRPLSQCVVTLITTANPVYRESDVVPPARAVYAVPAADPPARLDTDGLFWDRKATHTDDLDSYLPVHRMQEFARDGRIGRLATRLHGVPTEYSQRKTMQVDAPELLRRCREDGVDAALLVPL
jgi:hypothetical protein